MTTSNAQAQFKTVVVAPDGTHHDSKAAALEHMRKPKILAAFMQVTNGNSELSNWLLANREQVEVAFETGTIQRVTKSESKKLSDALDHIATVLADDKKAAFVTENIGAIKESFRWPSVKRMTDDEKTTAARNTLVAASEGNEELADYILANKDSILSCYSAGIEKRTVDPKAAAGLEAWRKQKAAEKAAAEAEKAKETAGESSEA